MMKRTTGPVSLTWGTPECIGYAELEQAWKYMTISFHPCRSTGKQIWPCHKNGQGQPCDIVWTNLVEIVYPMLYTKFQGHRPLGSEEEDFWRFLPYMGLDAIGTFEQIFIPTSHGGSIWNLASNGLVYFEEEVWKCWVSDLGQRSLNDLDLGLSCRHVLIYLTICTNFHLTGFNSFSEIYN